MLVSPLLFPVGIVAITILYVGIDLALRSWAPKCMDPPCQSEGVDDTVIMWGSDLLVAAVAFVLGVHLHVGKASTRKSGILAQIFLAGSFALLGIVHWTFSNNGQGDNLGMVQYWIVSAVASFFLAISASCHAYFAIECTLLMPKGSQPKCTIRFVQLFLCAVTASCLANLAGCAWCALTPAIQTGQLHDSKHATLTFSEQNMCIQIVTVSDYLVWFTYALLWMPMGLVLRAVAQVKRGERHPFVSLSMSTAALLAIISQWTTGSMYFVVIGFTAWLRQRMGWSDESFMKLWDRTYGAEIFHIGMLWTVYCAHKLAWTMTLPKLPVPIQRRNSGRSASVLEARASDEKQVRFSEEKESVDAAIQSVEEGTVSSRSHPSHGDDDDDDDDEGDSSICTSSLGSVSAAHHSRSPPSPRRRPSAIKSSDSSVSKSESAEEQQSTGN